MPGGDFCCSNGPHQDEERFEGDCSTNRLKGMAPSGAGVELSPSFPFLPPPPRPVVEPPSSSIPSLSSAASTPAGASGISTSMGSTSSSGSTFGASNGNGNTKRPAPKAPLRKGKWTPEEEVYAHYIIDNFNKGLISLPRGTTLRSYLSEKLNCDPMRVTKKFSGTSCIGKSVFCPCEPNQHNLELMKEVGAKLNELEKDFRNKIEHQGTSPHIDGLLRSMGRQWLGPLRMSEFNALDVLKPAFKIESLGRPPRPIVGMEREVFFRDGDLSSLRHRAVPPPAPPATPPQGVPSRINTVAPSTSNSSGNSNGSGNNTSSGSGNSTSHGSMSSTNNGSANVKRSRRPDADDFALTDQDAGDLLVNFFASVHRTYAEEGSTPEGSGSEGEPDECWASFKSHELAGEPDLVTQALKRQKVIDGC